MDSNGPNWLSMLGKLLFSLLKGESCDWSHPLSSVNTEEKEKKKSNKQEPLISLVGIATGVQVSKSVEYACACNIVCQDKHQ